MIVGFVGQVGYVVDGDVLHVAIVAQGHGKKVARFSLPLCPQKMHQQRLALAARRAAPAAIAPAADATPIPEPDCRRAHPARDRAPLAQGQVRVVRVHPVPGDVAVTNVCNYQPSQGTNKDRTCLRPRGHEGIHLYDAAAAAAADQPPPISEEFTNAEIQDAISEEEIRKRAENLDAAQSLWERARDRSIAKIPCPECTGNGQVYGGALGDHCPTCHGTRVVADDLAEAPFEMPPFAELRAGLTAYGDALTWRRVGLPSGLTSPDAKPDAVERFKREKMTLPPASTVPTPEQIEALTATGKAKLRELAASAPPAPAPALPAPSPRAARNGFQEDGGMESTASDAELDRQMAEDAEFTEKR